MTPTKMRPAMAAFGEETTCAAWCEAAVGEAARSIFVPLVAAGSYRGSATTTSAFEWCAYLKERTVISFGRLDSLVICQRMVGVKIAAVMALLNDIEWA